MFGQVLDKLDAWLGRSFVPTSFLPFLIFLGANALMATVLAPEALKIVASTFIDFGVISGPVVWLAAAAAIAYVTDPLIGKTMDVLEGTYAPLSGLLSSDQTQRLRDLEQEEQRLGHELLELRNYKKSPDHVMDSAVREGIAKHENRAPKLISKARSSFNELDKSLRYQELIDVHELKKAGALLRAALRDNCAEPSELKPASRRFGRPGLWTGGGGWRQAWRPWVLKWVLAFWPRLMTYLGRREARTSSDLKSLLASWPRLVAYADEKLVAERSRVIYEKQLDFGSIPTKDKPPWILLSAPTRFGNKTAALRSFVETRFKFDFEFFWPIFQLVAQNDQKTMDALSSAKQKLDFCIRILLYTILFTAIWLVVAVFFRPTDRGWIILVLGTGGPLLTMLWMEAIYANYRSLAELIRSIILLKRFDILTALHQSLPADWEHEQEQWQALTDQLLWGSDVKITYQHSAKS